MQQELITRLSILAAFAAILMAAYLLWRRNLLSGTSQKTANVHGYQTNRPGILVFTTPDCVPCKKVHKPMILRILERVKQPVQFIEIDARQYPDLASQWGVVSVPTTFLLQNDGQSKYVHFGLVSETTLNQQIQELL